MTVASFIASQRTDHDVPHAVACRALEVAPSTFYKWRDRPPTPAQVRRDGLDEAVKASFDDSGGTPGTYGSPRVFEDLIEDVILEALHQDEEVEVKVTAEFVKQVRESLAGRAAPVTAQELEPLLADGSAKAADLEQ